MAEGFREKTKSAAPGSVRIHDAAIASHLSPPSAVVRKSVLPGYPPSVHRHRAIGRFVICAGFAAANAAWRQLPPAAARALQWRRVSAGFLIKSRSPNLRKASMITSRLGVTARPSKIRRESPSINNPCQSPLTASDAQLNSNG
jgi:hypothetical protein